MPNLLTLPPPPIQNNTDDFIWQEWFRHLRDDLSRATWKPALEILDTTTTIDMPTVDTVYKPPTLAIADGFSYDPTTGVIGVDHPGAYTFNLLLNCLPTAANKNVYFYIDVDFGSGLSPKIYSGRIQQVVNNAPAQILVSSSNYFPANSKIRMHLWADATVALKTTSLPGGAATVPACRVLWS